MVWCFETVSSLSYELVLILVHTELLLKLPEIPQSFNLN